jgi:hypothetical protein
LFCWLEKSQIAFPWFLSINEECSNASSLSPFPSKPEHPVQNLRARHMVKKHIWRVSRFAGYPFDARDVSRRASHSLMNVFRYIRRCSDDPSARTARLLKALLIRIEKTFGACHNSVRLTTTTTMKPFVGLLLALLVGVSMAFLKPMKPVQVMDGTLDGVESTTFFGLDNPGVRSDDKITPARKCTLGACVEGVLTSS